MSRTAFFLELCKFCMEITPNQRILFVPVTCVAYLALIEGSQSTSRKVRFAAYILHTDEDKRPPLLSKLSELIKQLCCSFGGVQAQQLRHNWTQDQWSGTECPRTQ